jgi:hypothetical protein
MTATPELPGNLPARAVWASPGGFSLMCACGMTIQVVIDGDPANLVQFAVTCDSCGQAHWITPAATAGEEPA